MGWLVVEDLFTVIALVVLPLLFAREGASRGLGIALLLTGVKVAALVAFTALVGPVSSRACSITSPERTRASCSRSRCS